MGVPGGTPINPVRGENLEEETMLFVLNLAAYQSCSSSHFTTLSSSGLGHSPFTGVTRVRIPLGSPTMLAIAAGEFEPLRFEPRPCRLTRCFIGFEEMFPTLLPLPTEKLLPTGITKVVFSVQGAADGYLH